MGVLTIGRLESGKMHNVIPETAYFAGTSRFFKLEVGQMIREAFHRIVEHTAAASRCQTEINYIERFPVVFNNEELASLAADSVKKSVGDKYLVKCEPWMASESMSYYLQKYPGVFAFLGIKNEKLGTGEAHHNPKFDLDESCLKNGVAVTVQYALDFLNK
jgi:metal-dependent amidase/aminoacylase/carboxypeptidase family protein